MRPLPDHMPLSMPKISVILLPAVLTDRDCSRDSGAPGGNAISGFDFRSPIYRANMTLTSSNVLRISNRSDESCEYVSQSNRRRARDPSPSLGGR